MVMMMMMMMMMTEEGHSLADDLLVPLLTSTIFKVLYFTFFKEYYVELVR